MPNNTYVLAAVLISAGITWALRALPFAVLAPIRDSEFLAYLGKRMPVGLLVILVVYTLVDIDFAHSASVVPAAVGLVTTIGVQLWRRRMILSIFAGTAAYVTLASLGAAGIIF